MTTKVIQTEVEIEFIAGEIPHALYRLYDAENALLYVGITRNLPVRMWSHAADKDWWPQVARKTMIWYPSELAARSAETIAIDIEKPLHNDIRPAIGDSVPPHGQRKGWNRTRLLAWHPSDPALVEWLEAEIKRRGGGRGVQSAILDEALARYRAETEAARQEQDTRSTA